ncbi:hypothetical protein K466DRAFT_604196 [Polyporus arcularius HHB13444]|uniref:Uncharacterized protein n=1 Tax=Polyporus arcularius HHB13444 TaxID=1314778 RepID=A0A5C3P0J1_9APHY|nr:hypothetical protein K466DRAFT_604196 [Polyporus arcularius HHB13444]
MQPARVSYNLNGRLRGFFPSHENGLPPDDDDIDPNDIIQPLQADDEQGDPADLLPNTIMSQVSSGGSSVCSSRLQSPVPSLTRSPSPTSTDSLATNFDQPPPLRVYTYARYFEASTVRRRDPASTTYHCAELYYYLRISRGRRHINVPLGVGPSMPSHRSADWRLILAYLHSVEVEALDIPLLLWQAVRDILLMLVWFWRQRWLAINPRWCKWVEVIQRCTVYSRGPFPDMAVTVLNIHQLIRHLLPSEAWDHPLVTWKDIRTATSLVTMSPGHRSVAVQCPENEHRSSPFQPLAPPVFAWRERYDPPDGYDTSLWTAVDPREPVGLQVVDVEPPRPVLTAQEWAMDAHLRRRLQSGPSLLFLRSQLMQMRADTRDFALVVPVATITVEYELSYQIEWPGRGERFSDDFLAAMDNDGEPNPLEWDTETLPGEDDTYVLPVAGQDDANTPPDPDEDPSAYEWSLQELMQPQQDMSDSTPGEDELETEQMLELEAWLHSEDEWWKVPPAISTTPAHPSDLLYYMRVEEPNEYLPTITIPLGCEGFRGPEERVYEVLICALIRAASEDSMFADDLLDMLLILRGLVRRDPAIPKEAAATFHSRIIDFTQYERSPEPLDQVNEWKELLKWASEATDMQTLRAHTPDFTDAQTALALQEVRDKWKMVFEGTQTGEGSVNPHAVSATSRKLYMVQRVSETKSRDPRMYATYTLDPRELEDIVLATPRPGPRRTAHPTVAVVTTRDPLWRA